MKKRIALLLFLIAGICTSASAQMDEQIDLLDKYYENAFEEWNVPGMAIAIVKDNNIIFEKGYGYADLDQNTKVDEHTLFAVASNTKAFTASALARLVEEGRLNWNDKVKSHLDFFQMSDPFVEQKMNLEDLLCHRSGLKTFSGDLLWYGTDKTPREVVKGLKYLKAEKEFRVEYGYSNIMYIAAGLVLETVTDTSLQDYFRHHFMEPLGMTRTLLSTSHLHETKNVATPYYLSEGKAIALKWLNWDNILAAGGIISSVHDMSKWLMLNASEGSIGDLTILRSESFQKLTTPHINFKVNNYTRKNQPSKHFSGYGLGWSLADYHGRKIISHGGGYDGMISRTCIVPEEKLGIVILTNSLNYLPGALVDKTLDVLLGSELEGMDYAGLYLKSYQYNQEASEKAIKETEKMRKTMDPKHYDLAKYAGIYSDKNYGEVKVWVEGEKLHFDMLPTDIFHAPLKHWNGHIFTFKFEEDLTSLPPGKLWFETDKNGEIFSLMIDVENPDFDFREFEFYRQ